MNLLLQNALVFTGTSLQQNDILVQEGIITAVGQNIAAEDALLIPAQGHIASPGFCDLHVHLRQPGYETKETIATGTAAAAAGGFTTVCCMPNLKPVPDNLHQLEPLLEAIQKDALVQVLPYGALTVEEQGHCSADIQVLHSFVCGFSDDGRGVQSDDMMRHVMEAVAGQGSFVAAHCEVDSMIPKEAVTLQENCAFAQQHGYIGVSSKSEWAEVERNISLAKQTGARLHICHTSTKESFALVRHAKKQGLPITCEVTPHNLLLCCDDITSDDGCFKMNPPLRTAKDKKAALEALLDGTIDAIATDHAPHTLQEKEGGFAKAMNGVVGLETAFASLYTHLVLPDKLSVEKLLHLLTMSPRNIIGEPQPTITVGQRANITLLDTFSKRNVNPAQFYTKGRSTPFAGWALQGWPVLTLYNDNIVFEAKRICNSGGAT